MNNVQPSENKHIAELKAQIETLLEEYGLSYQSKSLYKKEMKIGKLNENSLAYLLQALEKKDRALYEEKITKMENRLLRYMFGEEGSLVISNKEKWIEKSGKKAEILNEIPALLVEQVSISISNPAKTVLNKPYDLEEEFFSHPSAEMKQYKRKVKQTFSTKKQLHLTFSKEQEGRELKRFFFQQTKEIQKLVIYGKAMKEFKQKMRSLFRTEIKRCLQEK